MKTLWFVVPVHGRLPLASICLRQLRKTCDLLRPRGVEATAVIVGDSVTLRALKPRKLGFGAVERDNYALGRKYNDGIQAATDPAWNGRPADYVVPLGSDDWVHPDLFRHLPRRGHMTGFRWLSFVREDGQEMTTRYLNTVGGCGIRIYSRDVLEPVGWRPCDEHRRRGCDTSILHAVQARNRGLAIDEPMTDPRYIVDWKSPNEQLNTYGSLRLHRKLDVVDPFVALDGVYPPESLRDMQAHYAQEAVAA